MPHGPGWNRLNLAGRGILAVAALLLLARIAGWILPDGNAIDRAFHPVFQEPYKWIVDVFLAGVIGYGLYFWFSGRVWCRFFCPLAALMHVYARFSRFAIVPDKKKCISCNACTSVCHQGIDVMSFANRESPCATRNACAAPRASTPAPPGCSRSARSTGRAGRSRSIGSRPRRSRCGGAVNLPARETLRFLGRVLPPAPIRLLAVSAGEEGRCGRSPPAAMP